MVAASPPTVIYNGRKPLTCFIFALFSFPILLTAVQFENTIKLGQSVSNIAPYSNSSYIDSESSHIFNVLNYGAKGDGKTDDKKAFLAAWKAACRSSWSRVILLIPKGITFLLSPVTFHGPCNCAITVQVNGTLLAPEDPKVWQNEERFWIEFKYHNHLIVTGNGTINGQGRKWWSCVREKKQGCPSMSPPRLVRISESTNILVENLTLVKSQNMHLEFQNCRGVKVRNLKITSPSDSPNTDGIHLGRSMNVHIQNCTIGTGDDCVSIASNTYNVHIQDVKCGPGHGISVGSLGRYHQKAQVSNILVDGAILRGTSYGARIKTWQGGSGFARNITFQNIKMHKVREPILIDQYYCMKSAEPCYNATSAVEVSEVLYKNITGTSKTEEAIRFACSERTPCRGIILKDVDLSHTSNGKVYATCDSASGLAYGKVVPSTSCLQWQL